MAGRGPFGKIRHKGTCDCECGGTLCCGRSDLPDTLYLTVTDLVNCNCNDWLGITIPVSKSMFTQGPGLMRWAGCYKGPCTEINGVGLLQGVTLILECTEGEIGQAGDPIDLVLFMYFGLGDPDPCPTNLDDLEYGTAPPESTPTAFAETGSTCSPLLVTYRFSADEFSVRCQDPMSPPGVSEIEWTLSE